MIVNNMKIVVISHERSLNKAETIINNLHISNEIFLVVEQKISAHKTYANKCHQIIEAPSFDVEIIKSKISHCDKVFCVSENLIPVQSELEKYFGISNISNLASKVLSNKFELHKFCMSNQLENFCPKTIIPCSEEMLDVFSGKVIVKPDIGTGSNRFLPNKFCDLEYKVWDSARDLISFLKKLDLADLFFQINKESIKINRFNYKPCKMLVQSFITNDVPVYAPCGLYKNGVAKISFFVKTNPALVNYSKGMADVGNKEVYSVPVHEVPQEILSKSKVFIEKLLTSLNVKEIFFSGPDIYPSKGSFYAIDFNPRPGHFFNLIDKINNGSVFESTWSGKRADIFKNLHWKAIKVDQTDVTSLNWIQRYISCIPPEARNFKVGDSLPRYPTLQSNPRAIQLMVSGDSDLDIRNKLDQISNEINFELNSSSISIT